MPREKEWFEKQWRVGRGWHWLGGVDSVIGSLVKEGEDGEFSVDSGFEVDKQSAEEGSLFFQPFYLAG